MNPMLPGPVGDGVHRIEDPPTGPPAGPPPGGEQGFPPPGSTPPPPPPSWQPPGAQPPGYGYGQGFQPQRPPTYLAPAILTTLFCCLPFGIVAIVFAAQVGSKYDAGDFAGAAKASDDARRWTTISFAVGLAVVVVWFLVVVLAASDSNALTRTVP